MKQSLLGVLGIFSFCFALTAQPADSSFESSQTFALYRPEIFNTVDGSTLIERLPVRIFLDGSRLPFSTALGRMGTAPLNFPSIAFVQLAQVRKTTASARHPTDGKDYRTDGKDSPNEMMLSQSDPMHYGGEMGVFYGAWSGKYSGDAMGTYLQGSIGNDKFEITLGASYQEWNVQSSRGRH